MGGSKISPTPKKGGLKRKFCTKIGGLRKKYALKMGVNPENGGLWVLDDKKWGA